MGNDRTPALRSGRGSAPAPRRALIAALLALAVAARAAAAAPQRIASLNLCTDSLLLELVDDRRIASVTALSRDPALSYFHDRAAQLPVNHGAVEEILAAAPDLVVGGHGTTGLAEHLLAETGITVLAFEQADTFDAYAANLMRLAAATGTRARARRLLERLWRRLDGRTAPRPAAGAPRAIVYQPNGYAPGTDTLVHDILRRAGLHDLADDLGLARGGFVPLERLLVVAPDLIVEGARGGGAPSLAEQLLRHPALRGLNAHRVSLAQNLWTCAGAYSVRAVDALERLAR